HTPLRSISTAQPGVQDHSVHTQFRCRLTLHSRMTLPCTAPTLSKLRRWSYERQAMPPMTKGQSGQVHDDRSLSMPQLSASAAADGFESYWNSDTFKDDTSHCR